MDGDFYRSSQTSAARSLLLMPKYSLRATHLLKIALPVNFGTRLRRNEPVLMPILNAACGCSLMRLNLVVVCVSSS